MNPLLIIGALAVGAFALFSGKKATSSSSGTTIKVPSLPATVKTPVGNVSLKVPTVANTQSGTTITIPEVIVTPETRTAEEIPETTIKASPADTSFLLTAAEQSLLTNGTADDIYNAASQSSHEAFVTAAGLVLAGKGDARASAVAQWVTNWNSPAT